MIVRFSTAYCLPVGEATVVTHVYSWFVWYVHPQPSGLWTLGLHIRQTTCAHVTTTYVYNMTHNIYSCTKWYCRSRQLCFDKYLLFTPTLCVQYTIEIYMPSFLSFQFGFDWFESILSITHTIFNVGVVIFKSNILHVLITHYDNSNVMHYSYILLSSLSN